MDYQLFVKNLKKLACVVSVKVNPDGTHSEPCIEAANDLYLKSVNVDPKDFEQLAEMSAANISTESNPRPMTKADYLNVLQMAYDAD